MNGREIFETGVRWCYAMQEQITQQLEDLELRSTKGPGEPHRPALFREDLWDLPQDSKGASPITGGGGRTRAIENGRIFEKGGVSVSDVSGHLPPDLSRAMPGESPRFRTTGIVIALHPLNPHAPAAHADFRIVKRISEGGAIDRLWFSGSADLAPSLLYDDDARDFHSAWRDLCGRFPDIADHPRLKKACDDRFYLPHREEHRGIGGILYEFEEKQPDRWLEFMKEAGSTLLRAYLPILDRRAHSPFALAERDLQLLRRGRSVEFNLLCDAGTAFGLRTGLRTESVLMDLPSPVHWRYNYDPASDISLEPEPRQRAARLNEVLRHPVDW